MYIYIIYIQTFIRQKSALLSKNVSIVSSNFEECLLKS